jgi:hypothetical protein
MNPPCDACSAKGATSFSLIRCRTDNGSIVSNTRARSNDVCCPNGVITECAYPATAYARQIGRLACQHERRFPRRPSSLFAQHKSGVAAGELMPVPGLTGLHEHDVNSMHSIVRLQWLAPRASDTL